MSRATRYVFRNLDIQLFEMIPAHANALATIMEHTRNHLERAKSSGAVELIPSPDDSIFVYWADARPPDWGAEIPEWLLNFKHITRNALVRDHPTNKVIPFDLSI